VGPRNGSAVRNVAHQHRFDPIRLGHEPARSAGVSNGVTGVFKWTSGMNHPKESLA